MRVEAYVLEDDDHLVAKEVRPYLRRHGYAITPVDDPEQLIEAARAGRCDIILLAPNRSGMGVAKDVVRQVREVTWRPIVVVHPQGLESEALDLLDIGADDFVCRNVDNDDPIAMRELRTRLSSTLRRSMPHSDAEEAIVIGDLVMDRSRRRVTRAGRVVRLTRVEYALLEHLACNAGRIVPHAELLEAVWSNEKHDRVEYLRTFVSRLRKALGWPAPTEDGPNIRVRKGEGYYLDVA